MKNQEQVQWSVLPEGVEVLRLVLEICSSIIQECCQYVVVVESFFVWLVKSLLYSSWNVEA